MSRQSAPLESTLATVAASGASAPPSQAQAVASWPLELALVLAGLLLAAWLWRRGVLAARYLRGTPRRLARFGWRDLLAVFGLVLLGQVLATALIQATFGVAAFDDPQKVGLVTLTLQLGSFGPATLWVLVRAMRMRRGLRRLGLFFRPGHLWAAVRGLPVAWLLSAAVLLMSATVVSWLGRDSPTVQHNLLQTLQADRAWSTLLPIALSAIVIAPLCEEVLTRGLVQTLLLRLLGHRWRWLVVALASGGFMMLHVGVVPPQTLPGLFVLGMVFGALYERTGSLVPGILVHAAFNALNVALVSSGLAGGAGG